jgi:arginyl-tRNA synthetase
MKNSLSNLFVDYFNKNNFSDLSKIEVLKTKDLKFGDYTTNLPLKISKDLGKAPMDVANEIRDFLIENFNSYFSEVTVTNPGFVNMFLTKDLLVENAINYFVESFKPNFNSIPKLKINYEYISANPTGDLHIGHARNAIVGDVVTRVLEYVGHNVDREYYVNDGGNQITVLAQSVY